MLGPVPDVLSEFVPDVDPARLEQAARGWRAIASVSTAATTEADRALRAALATNHGAVFDATAQYWSRVHVSCGTDTLLDLATLAPTTLAGNLDALAEIVRWTQTEAMNALGHRMPDAEATYDLIQGAKAGVGLLGPAGRIGVRFVDAFEIGTRIGLARRNYLERVDALAAQLGNDLIARLDRAARNPPLLTDVVARFTPSHGSAATATLPALHVGTDQLDTKFKHASDFGDFPPDRRGRAAFAAELERFVAAPGTVRKHGTYRGQPVIHNFDRVSALNVIQSPTGELISAWRLVGTQLKNVEERGRL